MPAPGRRVPDPRGAVVAPPLWLTLPLFAAGLLIALGVSELLLRLFPRTLAPEAIFRGGSPRRWARLASGLVILVAFWLPLAALYREPRVGALLRVSLAVFALGLADDFSTLPRWLKAAAVAGLAVWAAALGLRIDVVKEPFGQQMLSLGAWSWVATVIWLTGVTGAIVLSRRLQGLGTGLVAVVSLTFLVVALLQRSTVGTGTACLAAVLAGAMLGYLRYDFPPARLPVGSAGYYFLGFSLAGISVLGALKNTAFLTIVIPLLLFGVPLLDTTYATVLRVGSRHTLALSPRREFLHTMLMREGLGPRRCVAIYCTFAAYLGALAVLLVLMITVSFVAKLVVLGALLLFGGVGFYCAVRIASRPPAAEGSERVELFDIPVDRTDMEGALRRIRQFVEERSPHMVVTSDSSAIVRSQSDQEFKQIMRSADLVTPDGAGVVWAARVLGLPIWERVSGVDLMQRVCELAAGEGYSVYLLGAQPGVAAAAAHNLAERYPGLRIAGTRHGYFTPEEEPAIVGEIARLRPDVLFVAFGLPKQEKWIRRYLEELQVPVAVGVGGSFDVISGRLKRAPRWMQVAGVEWLYRSLKEPKRFKRLGALPRFVLMALRERWRRFRQGG